MFADRLIFSAILTHSLDPFPVCTRLEHMRLSLAMWPALCLLGGQPNICVGAVAPGSSAKAYHASTQYLEEYGTLYDHLSMLSDHERMRSYHDAIHLNAESQFKGKVVLDVGTGTGVLAIWAAQAGARRVFAVEGTSVANHAETMAKAHGFDGVIEVLRGRMEDVQLPEPVDVIISEWMGYFLLRESMIQSVIYARDRWLKPDGVMYPSSARLLLSTLQDKRFINERELDSAEALQTWDASAQEMQSAYGLDFTALSKAYREENHAYTYRQVWQGRVPGRHVARYEVELLRIDMHNATKETLFGWSRRVTLEGVSSAQGLVGYFDVRFCGNEVAPADRCIELTTTPHAPPTHWGQSALLFDPVPQSNTFTVGLTSCSRSQHDLNFTVSYDDTHASYSISSDFRGYQELGDTNANANTAEETGRHNADNSLAADTHQRSKL